MLTPEIIPRLRPEVRPLNAAGGSQDSFQKALPYWQNVFSDLIDVMTASAASQFGPGVEEEIKKLVQMVRELCEPDPLQRGHPKNRQGNQNRYGLERYISTLNFMRQRLLVKAA